MKKIYWRPHTVSRAELFLIAMLSVGGLIAVHAFRLRRVLPHYKEKIAAAQLAERAFKEIKAARQRLGPPIDPETDIAQTGLIGLPMSPVTTSTGDLYAKQTTVNPNFAAVLVHLLKRAGVEAGDSVALGLSGSFPALNIAAYAAVETLDAKAISIVSVSGSQFGANTRRLLWVDMERILEETGIFSIRAAAASRGGVEDKATGLSKRGQRILDNAIKRNNLRVIAAEDFVQSIEERMAIYREVSGGAPIKAYINIGGGTVSVGTRVGKHLFRPGLNRSAPSGLNDRDAVMVRFIQAGTPVIHMINIHELAQRYGLPLNPKTTPRVGEGKVFVTEEYNLFLAGGVLAAILLAMVACIRLDWGFRILHASKASARRKHPEPMV